MASSIVNLMSSGLDNIANVLQIQVTAVNASATRGKADDHPLYNHIIHVAVDMMEAGVVHPANAAVSPYIDDFISIVLFRHQRMVGYSHYVRMMLSASVLACMITSPHASYDATMAFIKDAADGSAMVVD